MSTPSNNTDSQESTKKISIPMPNFSSHQFFVSEDDPRFSDLIWQSQKSQQKQAYYNNQFNNQSPQFKTASQVRLKRQFGQQQCVSTSNSFEALSKLGDAEFNNSIFCDQEDD
eukprot:TRINITY_DN694_c2_g1_i1.p7 TRINITY_DN694_c2_g1~~TRINITY_DN694_c2_g1_i1.p7  ORF type:complete len:113 (-),score=7.39 TRINITY_DN694_c2_g1_i1:449-787(-)